MDPLWTAETSKAISDKEAAEFLRGFVKESRTGMGHGQQGRKNVSKDIRKLHRSVEAMSTWKKTGK